MIQEKDDSSDHAQDNKQESSSSEEGKGDFLKIILEKVVITLSIKNLRKEVIAAMKPTKDYRMSLMQGPMSRPALFAKGPERRALPSPKGLWVRRLQTPVHCQGSNNSG